MQRPAMQDIRNSIFEEIYSLENGFGQVALSDPSVTFLTLIGGNPLRLDTYKMLEVWAVAGRGICKMYSLSTKQNAIFCKELYI